MPERCATVTITAVPAIATDMLVVEHPLGTPPFKRRSLPHFPRGITADLTEIPGGATTQWWSSGWEIAEWPDGRRELRRISGTKLP
jgi:hypothetical protein